MNLSSLKSNTNKHRIHTNKVTQLRMGTCFFLLYMIYLNDSLFCFQNIRWKKVTDFKGKVSISGQLHFMKQENMQFMGKN